MVRRSERGWTSGKLYSLLVCESEVQVLHVFKKSRSDALRMTKSSHMLLDGSGFRGS